MSATNAPIAKKLALPKGKRLVTYYDTQSVIQNKSKLSFFPANASRIEYDNNYVTNPLPGNKPVAFLGMSIEATLQVIKTAANVDPVKIINALKYAKVKFTADQNDKRMFVAKMEDFFNFKSTNFTQTGGVNASNALVLQEAIELRSNGVIRFADPFAVAGGQVFTVEIEFADSSAFPTEAQWTTAGYGQLKLAAKLYAAE